MAKPLDERIAAAMGESARAASVGELVTEISAVIAAAEREHDEFDRQSKSATASEDAAEAAAEAAAKLSRRVIRLKAKRVQLEARHAELLNSESRKRRLAEQEAIKGRRDQLASDIRERWPALIGELTGLLARIEASDAEIAAAGNRLESAEAIARRVPANWYRNSAPVARLTKIKIPDFAGDGYAWPDTREERARRQQIAQQQHQELVRAKKAREEEAARFARYVVAPPEKGPRPQIQHRGGWVENTRMGVLEMTVEQAEAARKAGCEVELAAKGISAGLPSAASFL